jgi:hypothetical protein
MKSWDVLAGFAIRIQIKFSNGSLEMVQILSNAQNSQIPSTAVEGFFRSFLPDTPIRGFRARD